MINKWIKIFKKKKPDIVSELWGHFPSGITAPIIKTEALKTSLERTRNKSDLEHVTKYIFSHPNKFNIYLYKPSKKEKYPQLNLCIDEKYDYDLVNFIIEKNFKKKLNCLELINYIKKNQHLLNFNQRVKRKSRKYHKDYLKKIVNENCN